MAKEAKINNRMESFEKMLFKFYFALLPKLMKGEIRVKDSEILAEKS